MRPRLAALADCAAWLHYVPVQVDYTDLWDVLAFFRGTPRGEHAHDDLAEQIALAGRQWAQRCFRDEDLQVRRSNRVLELTRAGLRALRIVVFPAHLAQTFRQMLEYARLWALDRSQADFDGDTSVEPIWRDPE